MTISISTLPVPIAIMLTSSILRPLLLGTLPLLLLLGSPIMSIILPSTSCWGIHGSPSGYDSWTVNWMLRQ
jgi:hypothetical protein